MKKFSDTTLLNYMQNHKVFVKYADGRWLAWQEGYTWQATGNNIRQALSNLIVLARSKYEENSIVA